MCICINPSMLLLVGHFILLGYYLPIPLPLLVLLGYYLVEGTDMPLLGVEGAKTGS